MRKKTNPIELPRDDEDTIHYKDEVEVVVKPVGKGKHIHHSETKEVKTTLAFQIVVVAPIPSPPTTTPSPSSHC